VTIDIPKNKNNLELSASWQKITVCVNGVEKEMYVLGTAPATPIP
jgi:hypothetical protein